MTEDELWDLDEWIAVYVFGMEYDNKLRRWTVLDGSGQRQLVQSIAFTSGAFAQVKREIERRGWSWQSHYYPPIEEGEDCYMFVILRHGFVWSTAEELAGCLAFKAAVEATI